jgi:citronellyl-CoA dehydrogenase
MTTAQQEASQKKLLRQSLVRIIDEEINPYVDDWEEAQIFPAHEVFWG